MKAGSFDLDTSKEVIGDHIMRHVELKAREDADILNYSPPPLVDENDDSYWRKATLEMRKVVYDQQYARRVARNERKAREIIALKERLETIDTAKKITLDDL